VTIGKGDWQLPATLALPAGKARVAALVLVHGSGPNDRDESIGPQKPFRDLAEGLASRGVAVLRYEKRTRYAAAKLASIKSFTVQDETVDDALAAVEFLRGRPEIDPARVFVLGHSLGGYLMPRIGERDPKLAGLISLAGAARPLEDMIVEQNLYLASLQGNPPGAEAQINKVKADAQRVKALKADAGTAGGQLILMAPPSYWLDLQGYDPVMQARTLKQPLLFLQGERDYQVTMTDFARWQNALKDRPNANFRSFPALNHLFQAGEGKSTPAEYTAKPGHVAADVIDEIAAWINRIAP
jgi:dienelactone hydrolase